MKSASKKRRVPDLAAELLIAVSRLRHSKPSKPRGKITNLSGPQLLLLRRIEEEGETTASILAASENVSQQAIAQSLSALRQEGLIETVQDPKDERKSPVRVSEKGKLAINTYLSLHTKWLVRRIESRFAPEELVALERAIAVLERLAKSDDVDEEP